MYHIVPKFDSVFILQCTGFATVSRGWFHPMVIYYFHGREVGFIDGSSLLLLPRRLSRLRVVRWGITWFMKDIWYGTLLVSE